MSCIIVKGRPSRTSFVLEEGKIFLFIFLCLKSVKGCAIWRRLKIVFMEITRSCVRNNFCKTLATYFKTSHVLDYFYLLFLKRKKFKLFLNGSLGYQTRNSVDLLLEDILDQKIILLQCMSLSFAFCFEK